MLTGMMSPRSNKASWTQTLEVIDADTDEAIDLSGANIVFEIRERSCSRIILSATTDNGKVTIPDLGTFTFAFSTDEMRTLCPGTYDVGCTLGVNGETLQFIIGTLPVLDGIVA